MTKLSLDFQKQFADNLIFDPGILERIDPSAKLHDETLRHPLSSSAACLNVLGSLGDTEEGLRTYLNTLGFGVSRIFAFPSGANVGGQVYRDRGYVVFEWVGPRDSPINELDGSRGYMRTSVDAYLIAEIDGVITQVLVEWKSSPRENRAPSS
jgi:hypothetical protein